MLTEVVPCRDGDLPFLYHLAAEVEPAWLRVCGSGLPPPARFAEVVTRGVSAQFVLVGEGDLLLGAAAVYGVSPLHRNGWVEVVASPDCGDPVAVERAAFDVLLAHAFEDLSLRQGFLRYPEWAPPAIGSRWAVADLGRLPSALLHQGRYWDIGVRAVAPGDGS